MGAALAGVGAEAASAARGIVSERGDDDQVGFHLSGYRRFKHYYLGQVVVHQRHDVPGLVSYNRFVELLPGALAPLCCFLVSPVPYEKLCQAASCRVLLIPLVSSNNRKIVSNSILKFLSLDKALDASVGPGQSCSRFVFERW